MLLIACPYCGERPELEFAHGGQAHIARPAKPSAASVEEWTQFLYMRDNVKGVYAEEDKGESEQNAGNSNKSFHT